MVVVREALFFAGRSKEREEISSKRCEKIFTQYLDKNLNKILLFEANVLSYA